MYISIIITKIRPVTTLIIIGMMLCLTNISCSKEKNSKVQTVDNDCERNMKLINEKLNISSERIKLHDKDALLSIFNIASESYNGKCSYPELSEVASEIITDVLFSDTKYWIKSLSLIKTEKIIYFIENGGLASINSEDHEKNKILLLKRIKDYKGSARENNLRDVLVAELKKL